jgi:hypothetical protein
MHKQYNVNPLTLKQLDRAFISGSNIPAGGRGSGGGGISASLTDVFATSLSCFDVLFEASFAIDALRAVRGFGGILILLWSKVKVDVPYSAT